MRRLTTRVLTLLMLTGVLVFFGTSKSEATTCAQDCYNTYRPCLNGGGGDFYYCCAAYNECLVECGGTPKCHLPEPLPPQ